MCASVLLNSLKVLTKRYNMQDFAELIGFFATSLINYSVIHEHLCKIIRIYHECEGGIEKCIPRSTHWHHKACRVMKIIDHEGRIFLSHPHTNNGFFFLLTTKCFILYWKNKKKAFGKSKIR